MRKKTNKKRPANNTRNNNNELWRQFRIPLVFLLIGCLIIIAYLSIRYTTYDYNIQMRIVAVVPAIVGMIIISGEYFLSFNEKLKERRNNNEYFRTGWIKTVLILSFICIIAEAGVALFFGLFVDRNGNVLRFLADSSYSGLLIFILNIITSISVIIIQRYPLKNR